MFVRVWTKERERVAFGLKTSRYFACFGGCIWRRTSAHDIRTSNFLMFWSKKNASFCALHMNNNNKTPGMHYIIILLYPHGFAKHRMRLACVTLHNFSSILQQKSYNMRDQILRLRHQAPKIFLDRMKNFESAQKAWTPPPCPHEECSSTIWKTYGSIRTIV